MNKYIFDKEKAKLNQWQLLDVIDDNKQIDEENICYWVGNEYPTFSMFYDEQKNIIREKTKYEKFICNEYQLKDGEYIENREIKKTEKPNKHSFWENNKWTTDILLLKRFKREELKKIRDTKVRENISLYGAEFQVRNEKDIENFKDVERALDKGFRQLTDKIFWVLADNSTKEFTYEQLSKVLDEKAKRKEEIFKKFILLSKELEKANTIEEIENIKWEV